MTGSRCGLYPGLFNAGPSPAPAPVFDLYLEPAIFPMPAIVRIGGTGLRTLTSAASRLLPRPGEMRCR